MTWDWIHTGLPSRMCVCACVIIRVPPETSLSKHLKSLKTKKDKTSVFLCCLWTAFLQSLLLIGQQDIHIQTLIYTCLTCQPPKMNWKCACGNIRSQVEVNCLTAWCADNQLMSQCRHTVRSPGLNASLVYSFTWWCLTVWPDPQM